MKLTGRLWILAIFLIISIISIIYSDAYTKLMLIFLFFAAIILPRYVKSKTGKVFIFLIFILSIAFLVYNSTDAGVIVKSVNSNSHSFEQGLRQGQIIKSINGEKMSKLEDYQIFISDKFSSGENIRLDIITNKGEVILFTNKTPDITVQNIPKTNIKTGLDISGGARALIKPEGEISEQEMQDLIEVSRNRFNVFGISDVNIRSVTDLSGNKFMLVEVAGATPNDLEELISQQGKFEAKIANKTIFEGGEKDITSVCRNDERCAAITSCFPSAGSYICSFSFTIYLTEEAAKRHADVTRDIQLDPTSGGQYLQENLYLYLDDVEVDSLRISSGLRGQVTTQISIQGSGTGISEEDAFNNARESMHKLQTVLITGSLPYKLEVVKLDTISPLLGSQFVFLILIAGAGAIVCVSIFVLIRYRNFKASAYLLLTSFSELIIILGIASIIRWNLDLPSIAGILAVIGTGVDQQIVILDEAKSGVQVSIREKMKRALFIVMSAYVTALVSLIPLYWAGAGLFKGFAVTSIIGITAGVFITRPAFADLIKKLHE